MSKFSETQTKELVDQAITEMSTFIVRNFSFRTFGSHFVHFFTSMIPRMQFRSRRDAEMMIPLSCVRFSVLLRGNY